MLRRNLSNLVKNCLVLLVIIFLLDSLKFQEEMWDKIQNFLEIVLNTMVWLYVMVYKFVLGNTGNRLKCCASLNLCTI